ncbi:MAG: hypothetical protein RL757_956 [Bacteroidota bacterium]|jgi:outer membrane protein TolC
MKKIIKITFLFAFLGTANSLIGQNLITLSQCLDAAQTTAPINRQTVINDALYLSSMEQLKTIFFPQINFNAQATWQSEVTSLPIRLPNVEVPSLSKDQYRATLDVSQTLWDGGQTDAQRKVFKAQNAAENAKIQVDKYSTKAQTMQLFCAILLTQKQAEALVATKKDIIARKKRTEEQLKNGTAIPANIHVFNARLLEIEQQEAELLSRKNTAIQGISLLTGLQINENDRFELPNVVGLEKTILSKLSRPELDFFAAQQASARVQTDAVKSKYMPKLNAFSTLGYARPGLNFLSNTFQPYAILGVGFKTNISPFFNGTIRREQLQMQLQAEKIGIQQDQFILASQVQATQQQHDIERLEKALKTDQQIIALREKVVNTYAIQLENGVITPSEYLTESTNVVNAKVNQAIHEVQLLQAYLQLSFINGKL